MTLIVINQLPLQPETIWLRLLGRGTVQRQAIVELLQFEHPYRDRAIEQLKVWYQRLQTEQVGRESPQLMNTLAHLP